MRIICNIIILILCVPVFAQIAVTDVDRLTQLLTNWEESQKSVQQMESLHQSAKTKSVAIKSAFVLAQSPASWLKQKPALYAEFFLKNEDCSKAEDCFSLYRIAGDGHFENSRFSKASFWYEKGISDPRVSEKDREYLIYKNAWAYLNAKNKQKAFLILADWIHKNSKSLLREPMMTDLGRIYGEVVFEKNKNNIDLLEKLKLTEAQDVKLFLEGFFKAFLRFQPDLKRRELLYTVLLRERWSKEGMELLVTSSVFKETSSCEVMIAKPFVPAEQRKDARWEPFLQKCAVFISESKTKPQPKELKNLLDWMGEVPMSLMGEWGRAKISILSREAQQGCAIFSKMAEGVLSATNIDWKSSWFSDSLKSCAQQSGGLEFSQMIMSQQSRLQKENLLDDLIRAPEVELSLKINVLKTWKSSSAVPAVESMSVLLTEQPFAHREALLLELCPIHQESCSSLWWDYLQSSDMSDEVLVPVLSSWDVFKGKIVSDGKTFERFVAAMIVSNVKIDSTRDDVLGPIFKLRESLKTGDAPTFSEDFLKLASVQDAVALQKLGMPPQEMPSLSNDELIASLGAFQQSAEALKRRVWSDSSLKKMAQQKTAQWAIYWQKQISLRKATGAEKAQWKQVASFIKKWETLK